ncbi:Poly(A) polymerase I precursor [Candidatus Rubidus massiliensis]|nr:MAG: poly(A) polymerase [Chlamydia sp. 32-24]CDZ79552.1 Poly(A) polymerase I precursor [Candidatus Rubidus massiliensis]
MRPQIYHIDDHSIDHHSIDPDALLVMEKLKNAGFTAYLVGGGVRDLILKKQPKDFDISTSAKPEEIKRIFQRNCILIGRRFRLAHIRFGHKILEVSTFRTGADEGDLIVHDNEWGKPEEDVLRRDFTINGLFYDPSTRSVIDYVGGWKDIHDKLIRTIGNPLIRFRQDPVRMIRLLKFQARYGFSIDPPAQIALTTCKEELVKSSPARILEEMFRMLESGYASKFIHLMTEFGLLELLFPCLTHFLETKNGKEIYHYLDFADQINRQNVRRSLERSILTSCLLYPILEKEIQKQFLDKDINPHISDVMLVTTSLIKAFVTSSFSHFPRRISSTVTYILAMQYRLTPPNGKRHSKPKFVRNKEFILALKFLKLRTLINNDLLHHYSHWREIYRQAEHHKDRKHNHKPRPQHVAKTV